MKNILRTWMVPPGYYILLNKLHRLFADDEYEEYRIKLVSKNSRLYEKHKGERCFIVCNGPSVKHLDLGLLRGELVISVSNGYHHSQYSAYRPKYHCVPQINCITKDDIEKWFDEMHSKLYEAELFLSISEESLVKERNLLSGRKVNYILFNGSMDEYVTDVIPDLSKPVPGVQSVSIMALMIALYMGCDEIYLIGTDHDHFVTKKYPYFFDQKSLSAHDSVVDSEFNVVVDRYKQFHSLARLWRQYRVIKKIAKKNNIKIFNATRGGELDEFERVQFETLF